tara:strand:+ start:849 stop:1061 length:213 start_codon:yes stop_codon:yes gene_type:complete
MQKVSKNIFNTLATLLIALGIIMIAGSGGDCDGKCMEQANTISEMLMYAGIGLSFFITGTLILIKNRDEA